MCGIAGTVRWGDADTVARMTEVIRHRGPDDHDVRYFPEERVGLGHRRLSIIDLSPAGRQPMSTDGNDWIVFNGEIYNFLDLRAEQERDGETFQSHSDTEVLLRLYRREGVAGFARLNGMFAFALLDRKRRRLLLARDPLGIKPLYYHRSGSGVAFGSEIKAILESGIHSREPNWQGIYDYFTYLYVPSPETAFRDVFQVPPGHVLEIDLDTLETRFHRIWTLRARSGGEVPYEDDRATLRELLTDSVRRQMISDVPLGVFLSGGVDSPILTGLMAQASSRPVKTFTVVFRGKGFESYDEARIAREVAERFGTDHHEIPVEVEEPEEMLPLVEHFDQPFGNPTFYLMHLISRHTRPEAKVALCGAGGDELFAGYPRYRAMSLARKMEWVPGQIVRGARRLLDLPRDDFRSMKLRRAREFLSGLGGDFVDRFSSWTYFFDDADKGALLHPRLFETEAGPFLPSDRGLRKLLDESPLAGEDNRVLHLDVQTFLLDNLLEYTDKMSMAVGLEVRVPFLDVRVVEHGLNVPFASKLRGGMGKHILKDAFLDLLPASCLEAPKKGFNVPLAIWMRDRLGSYFDRVLTRDEVERQAIFRWDAIERLREEHRTGRKDNAYELFSIIMFDAWYRRYVLEEIACR